MSQAASAITRSPAEVGPAHAGVAGFEWHLLCHGGRGRGELASTWSVWSPPFPEKSPPGLNARPTTFVPLTVSQGEETLIADRYDVALSDNAVAIAISTWAIHSVCSSPRG